MADERIEKQKVKDRNTKEVEAESVAYTVCKHFGIDTSCNDDNERHGCGGKLPRHRNKVARRKRRAIIYIICEGKETETLWFKHFRTRNCLVDIVPIPSKHKAAEHLVKHAKSLISQSDYFPLLLSTFNQQEDFDDDRQKR